MDVQGVSGLGGNAVCEDDMTLSLHIQQFLDEWFFRVLHANLADNWDRETTLLKALELFEAGGATKLPEAERMALVSKEFEDEIVAGLVKIIPANMRRNMEHFLLQVQLVLSTATRVRMVLESANDGENTVFDVAKAMDDGDPGITQQILKQVVVRAVQEVIAVREQQKSWEQVMDVRAVRLSRCAAEAAQAEHDLQQINHELATFGSNQNSKSKSVLMGMCDGQDKVLKSVVMNAWIGWYTKFCRERAVHDKFRDQLKRAETKLVEYKLYQKSNVHGVMNRKNMATKDDLLREVLKIWKDDIAQEKEDRELGDKIKATRDKVAGMDAMHKENAQKAMVKICGGNDYGLKNVCFDSWAKDVASERKNKDFNDAVRKAEGQLKEYMKKKKDEARGVMDRMTGSTDEGLLFQHFVSWRDEYLSVKKGRELEDMIENQKSHYTALNARQKGAGYNTVSRCNQLEDETVVMHIFMNWVMHTGVERVIKHFGSKMDEKKRQLDQVQTMFKSFATQLEKGIGNTPRSQRTKGSRAMDDEDKGSGGRPPLQPAA
jgi:hypothetical protein